MSNVAIEVEGLGKRYRIGQTRKRHDSLRAALSHAARAPLRHVANLRRLPAPDAEHSVVWALRDVGFAVRHGEVLGIIGRNGAGKSTLLKILSRITRPTTGRARVYGRVGSLLEVGTGFHAELTGRENVYLNGSILGMDRAYIARHFDEIVEFSGVERFIDTPVKHYSSGMYLRLAFAVAAHLEPEILIVDEVLAVGDAAFQKKCIGKMQDVAHTGRAVLFVSHNMPAVKQLCHNGLLLSQGAVQERGAIEDTIRRYLADIEGAARRTELADRADRSGNQSLTFTRVALCNSAGDEVPRVVSGDDLRLRFFFRSNVVCANVPVCVSFNVNTSDGCVLANLNSIDSGQSLNIHGSGYFECHWPRFNCRAGTYDCTVFCSINGEIADWVQNAFVIDVEDGDFHGTGKLIETGHGPILIEHSWASEPERRGIDA